MNTYIVSYDLANADLEDYKKFEEAIMAYPDSKPVTDSLWAIVTEDDVDEVRDFLLKYATDESKMIVIKSAHEAAWTNVRCSNAWLQRYI